MSDADRLKLATGIGLTLGQFIHYKLLRRWGAPKWAAYSSAAIAAQLVQINETLKEG